MRLEKPEGSGHGGVAACSCALVNVVKSSGDRWSRACCHKSRMGLSVGSEVSGCNKWSIWVGVFWFGEVER